MRCGMTEGGEYVKVCMAQMADKVNILSYELKYILSRGHILRS